MSQTTRLALPLIEAAQSQKHVTHNEALVGLDALVQLSVRSRAMTPPAPSEGDRYLVAATASGVFANCLPLALNVSCDQLNVVAGRQTSSEPHSRMADTSSRPV